MFLKKFILLFICLLLSVSAQAANTEIVATVGDDAITTQDLVARTRLIVISSGLRQDEDTARKIAPQILQSLINERLQLQEAQKLGIKITDEDLNKAIAGVEQQNGMKPGELKTVLTKAQVPYSTLQQQVKGQIAWAKIRSKAIQTRAFVTEEETNDFLNAQRMYPTQIEYNVNEIVLPVDTAKDNVKVLATANKLVSELQKGTDFKKVAREFSQAASAQNGGNIGWLAENQIPKELLSEIRRVGPNKIIGPVKSVEGYFILRVDGARQGDTSTDTQIVSLRHFEVLLDKKNPKASSEKITSVNDPLRGCKDAQSYADSLGVQMQDYGTLPVKELQSSIRKVINPLPVGRYSEILNTGSSLVTFLVCSKTDTSQLPDNVQREKAREVLYKRKVELEARTYLRDMRRNTNIEIKLQ